MLVSLPIARVNIQTSLRKLAPQKAILLSPLIYYNLCEGGHSIARCVGDTLA